MACLADVFSEQEITNWLKGCLGLNIAKHALEVFVDRELKDVHTRMFQKVRRRLNLPATTVCTNCCTANLLKCPTHNVCKKQGKYFCKSMHNAPNKKPRPCSLKICDEVRDEIIQEHRYDQPSWKNTAAEHWENNHWQIAKCFLPPDGYTGVGSAHETDFNGIISVMLNCKHFDSKVSFSIAPLGSACLLSKAREIGRAVRHNSDCKMNNTDLQSAFSTFIGLLSDPTCLGQDVHAHEAINKIKQLQNDSLKITEAEMSQLLKNAQDTLNEMKQVADESMKMKVFVENFYQKHAALEDEDYEQAVKDFVGRLKHHYNLKLSHVSISALLPSGDESLNKIYAAPAICRVVESSGGNKTKNPITTYKEILYTCENEKVNKCIFLQGEAGMGKSTFASKLVLDWCNQGGELASPSKTFGDANTLQEFKLALLITLRDSICERDVTNMIKEQIIDMVYTDTERKDAYVMLNKIMQQEMCLVVQDGLDEWKDPQGKLAQPIMLSCYTHCTVFTTTRPWKLTDERIRKSQIDSLFELKGVSNPYELCKSLLDSFGCNTFVELVHYVSKNNLHALLFSPMLLSLIVSSWVDGTLLTGSLCEIYTVLIDGLFKKVSENIIFFVQPPLMCFQNTRYLQQSYEHLQAISKTAFLMLFSAEQEQALVISDRQLSHYLTQEQKDFALKTGIITERKCVSRTYQRSTCSFIHKSVQEFLAAVHIALNSADLVVVARYFAENSNAIFENQIFIFLCGLNILLANELSRIIDSTTTTEYLFSTYISGFIEAQANGQNPNDIDLKLSRFRESNFKCDASRRILQMNKSNAKLLQIGSVLDVFDRCWKEFKDDETVVREFDLSSFRNLESLEVCTEFKVRPYDFHRLSQLKELKLNDCECKGLDLSSCHRLEVLDIFGTEITLKPNALNGLAQLKELKLHECECKGLDLSSCHRLEVLDIFRGKIRLTPNALNGLAQLKKLKLHKCECKGFDLSSCHRLEVLDYANTTLTPNALNGLAQLKKLKLHFCECKGLDLSSCHRLEVLDIFRGRIRLTPNALNGLAQLKKLKIRYCKRTQLNLSSCHNLETIDFHGEEGEQIAMPTLSPLMDLHC
ncbi:uncharacterized protein LOC127843272 isoform X4 [Dreissena polymorpha]|uniref:uncharacterized protein LOC127843272 isoform X4 n=1 Tax=Dreissena polymorpha TaxID=45954 RepID=UPI0022643957|nr:uncharacterized protein LOC127843272 isoform X4 [Dreissena polymorpha]